jgi:hypothetical protein
MIGEILQRMAATPMTKRVVFYTVFNQPTNECFGDDFTINGALDAITRLNLEDQTDQWSCYANDSAQVLDSMISLVPVQ